MPNFTHMTRISNYDQFPISVKKVYTDVDGQLINKASLPSGLQVEVPFYLFGKMDKDGAYKIANKTAPPQGDWLFFYFGVGGSYDFQYFTGLQTVRADIMPGDYVFIYTDNLDTPSYFCYIIISSGDRSYASINDNIYNENLIIRTIVYATTNIAQYSESMDVVKLSRSGLYRENQFNPTDFRNPDIEQEDIIRMKMDLRLNQYMGINSYILFDTDKINFNVLFKLGQ